MRDPELDKYDSVRFILPPGVDRQKFQDEAFPGVETVSRIRTGQDIELFFAQPLTPAQRNAANAKFTEAVAKAAEPAIDWRSGKK